MSIDSIILFSTLNMNQSHNCSIVVFETHQCDVICDNDQLTDFNLSFQCWNDAHCNVSTSWSYRSSTFRRKKLKFVEWLTNKINLIEMNMILFDQKKISKKKKIQAIK